MASSGCLLTSNRDRRHSLRTVLLLSALVLSWPAIAESTREIAFTFDDAPRNDGRKFSGAERTAALIASLEKGGIEGAIFFSNSERVDAAGHQRLLAYQQAGHYIANHSHSHPFPHRVGLDAYVKDIHTADKILSAYDSFLSLYRFPFLDEGRDEKMRDGIRGALAEMNYRHGYVTVDNYDWYMEHLFQRALEQGRSVDYTKLGELYVTLLLESVEFYDRIAQQVLGRSPRHVLLLHENDLAALYVADLARALQARGWTIIPGPQAYEDPIAEVVTDTLFNGQGRVAAIAETQGVARRDLVHEAEDEAWLEARFDALNVFGDVPAGDQR
jgi:peptidoglycan/xylan/chitin deacetylase (PgdA/CDA1 family)